MRNQHKRGANSTGNAPKSASRKTSSGKNSKKSTTSKELSFSNQYKKKSVDKNNSLPRMKKRQNSSSRIGDSGKTFIEAQNNERGFKRKDFKKKNIHSYGTPKKKVTDKKEGEGIRLNKYIANAGICSRREADTYIQTGVVTVNGETITELGYKIKPGDRVMFGGKPVIGEKPVYILLNKPKDYITTSKDPQNRRTVFDLISGVKERVFAVGRLDRNTTGLLLLTNDGELADKLMHPRKKVVKIYHVELDRKFTHAHLEQMREGLTLEDGFFKPDDVSFVEGLDKKHVGIEIHSGKNRIVRRLFEHFGYKVVKLDRVLYAGLTKKGLPRGAWRFLEPREVGMLKML
ncbi:MAG: rRNA pseudouridine synthase [Flavobacteriales bacterium]|nr:rRNA pseudouridine synthase [Flavobacteriales bacterium]